MRLISVLLLTFVASACRPSLPAKVRAYGAWKLACRDELIEATVSKKFGDEWGYRLDCFDWNQDHIWVMCRNDVCRDGCPGGKCL